MSSLPPLKSPVTATIYAHVKCLPKQTSKWKAIEFSKWKELSLFNYKSVYLWHCNKCSLFRCTYASHMYFCEQVNRKLLFRTSTNSPSALVLTAAVLNHFQLHNLPQRCERLSLSPHSQIKSSGMESVCQPFRLRK